MLLLFSSLLCVFFHVLTPGVQSSHMTSSRTAKFDNREKNYIPDYRTIQDNTKFTSEFTNMSGICGPNAKFSINSNGQLFIYGRGQMFNYSTSNSPISSYAEQIKSISIGNEITTIGTYSFSNCNYLESVEIGRNIEKIFDSPFYNCSRLKHIKFAGSYSPLCSNKAFSNIDTSNSSQINIQIEDSNYHSQTFCGKPISLNKSITNSSYAVKSSSFLNQKHIDEINTGECGTECTYELNTENGELIISGSGKMKDYYSSPFSPIKMIKTIIINDGITSIGNYAFFLCTNLISIEIPNSVTSIGDYAFRYCSNLASIEIPSSVTSIGNNAFYECSSLESITVNKENQNYRTENYVLFSKDMKILIKYPQNKGLNSYEIPNNVISISDYAFYTTHKLASIEIPNSVTSIGDYAFQYCISLANIEILNSATSIGNSAFKFCSSLASIEIDSVTSLGDSAFESCSKLASIKIPSSVKSIPHNVFLYCSNLASIEIPKSVTLIQSTAFGYCPSLESIIVENGNQHYKIEKDVLFSMDMKTLVKYPPKKNPNLYEIPNGVTSIGSYAFQYFSNLASIKIPNSVKSIGGFAFSGCFNLKSIEIPNSVTTIGSYAFHNCSSLETIEIPNSVTSISEGAFSFCSSLESITVNDDNQNYKTENDVLFSKDMKTLIKYPAKKNLNSYEIPNSVESISRDAFESCLSLATIIIPENVTEIGYTAFSSCTNLATVYFHGSEEPSYDSTTFYDCPQLHQIIITNNDYTATTFGGLPIIRPSSAKSKPLSAGAIAGIVIACIAVVGAVIAVVVYFFIFKKTKKDESIDENHNEEL